MSTATQTKAKSARSNAGRTVHGLIGSAPTKSSGTSAANKPATKAHRVIEWG
ncbi:hypothetical protein BDS110ZK4_84050 [Bradyrhizobium diazoefficiens]